MRGAEAVARLRRVEAVRVVDLLGVPIRLRPGFFLALPLLGYLMSLQIGAAAERAGLSAASLALPPIWLGSLLALALFGCVLAHELAHVAVAQALGARVRGVTLMLLGGVSEIERFPAGAGGEALVALSGPAASLALSFLCYGGAAISGGDLRLALHSLAELNLAVGLFNLLPAFPLDGGRALRSGLEPWLGRLRATRGAAYLGMGLAVLIALLGVWARNPLYALIAAFIYLGAKRERQVEEARAALAGHRVGEVASRGFGVELSAPVSEAARRLAFARRPVAAVTVGGVPVGVLSAAALEKLPKEAWETTAVGEIAILGLPVVTPEDDLVASADRMGELSAPALPVRFEDGQVGTLTPADVARAL
jgi:Zn-dependent protease